MANPEHLEIIKQGVEVWNRWREENPEIEPDLSEADLSNAFLNSINLRRANLCKTNLNGAFLHKADLSETDLRETCFYIHTTPRGLSTGTSFIGTNLSKANLSEVDLRDVNLIGANLSGAILNKACFLKEIIPEVTLMGASLREVDLSSVDFSKKDLSRVDLSGANLGQANLTDSTLREANLTNANLNGTILLRTNLESATLNGCSIYGISTWDLRLEGARQSNLIITPEGEQIITVDNLEVAQFIYLLLNNQKIRQVIDTITSKVVLILGRFTPERKAVLDMLREELRKRNYSPVLFDFDKPASRDITETVTTLAHMARFVIADITDAKSIPQELAAIVPHLPSVPVQPLLLESQPEYGMFEHFTKFPWVLPTYHYRDQTHLLATLKEQVIEPAECKANELIKQK